MKKYRVLGFGIAIVTFVIVALRFGPDSVANSASEDSSLATPSLNESATESTRSERTVHSPDSPEQASSSKPLVDESQRTNGTSISLTSGNFESFVFRCFQGEKCDFVEDPIAMYKEFRISRNDRACDNLISFLRSKMRDEQYRKRYKDVLKKMIDDFYSPEEKPLQEAAYYNYLGDLQRSLDLYLDLERKSKTNPTLRPAPKLNIANLLYDLKRYRDSLPYYQAALHEYVEREQEVALPSQNEMIRFIEERIEDVKQQL